MVSKGSNYNEQLDTKIWETNLSAGRQFNIHIFGPVRLIVTVCGTIVQKWFEHGNPFEMVNCLQKKDVQTTSSSCKTQCSKSAT